MALRRQGHQSSGRCLEFLSRASADELRVLIAMASGTGEPARLAEMSGVSAEAVLAAIRFWAASGMVSAEGLEAPEKREAPRPSYSGEEMERICEDGDMKELIDVCSVILGKTMTPAETESILYLHDGLRLDFEYVVKLCKHCHDIGKPALRYIEKVESLYTIAASLRSVRSTPIWSASGASMIWNTVSAGFSDLESGR